jgi:hypothetical protein
MKDFDEDPLQPALDGWFFGIVFVWIPGCLFVIGLTIYLFWFCT